MMFHQILNGVFMAVISGGKMCADTILTETEHMEEKRQRNMLFQSVYCLMYGWMKNIKNVPNAKRHVRRRKMDRMTHERVNGIRAGYWSPEKKEELVQRLAAYENTGLEPEEISAKIEACNIYKSLGLTPDQILRLKERMELAEDIIGDIDDEWTRGHFDNYWVGQRLDKWYGRESAPERFV